MKTYKLRNLDITFLIIAFTWGTINFYLYRSIGIALGAFAGVIALYSLYRAYVSYGIRKEDEWQKQLKN